MNSKEIHDGSPLPNGKLQSSNTSKQMKKDCQNANYCIHELVSTKYVKVFIISSVYIIIVNTWGLIYVCLFSTKLHEVNFVWAFIRISLFDIFQ